MFLVPCPICPKQFLKTVFSFVLCVANGQMDEHTNRTEVKPSPAPFGGSKNDEIQWHRNGNGFYMAWDLICQYGIHEKPCVVFQIDGWPATEHPMPGILLPTAWFDKNGNLQHRGVSPRLSLVASIHDDVIKWKHFPHYWPFMRGIHRSRWLPSTKASDAELWCFLWFAPE